jgi:hypothetical protein
VFGAPQAAFTTNGPVLSTGSRASFSVAAWVYLNTLPGLLLNATAVSQDGNVNSAFYLQYIQPHNANIGTWAFARPSKDASQPDADLVHSDQPVKVQAWTFLVGVFDGATGQLQLYVNGVLQQITTATDSSPYPSTGGLAIGRGQFGGDWADWFPGFIRDVEVWDTALSGTQAQQLYTASSAVSQLRC